MTASGNNNDNRFLLPTKSISLYLRLTFSKIISLTKPSSILGRVVILFQYLPVSLVQTALENKSVPKTYDFVPVGIPDCTGGTGYFRRIAAFPTLTGIMHQSGENPRKIGSLSRSQSFWQRYLIFHFGKGK